MELLAQGGRTGSAREGGQVGHHRLRQGRGGRQVNELGEAGGQHYVGQQVQAHHWRCITTGPAHIAHAACKRPAAACPSAHLGPLGLLEVLHVDEVGGHAGHVARGILGAVALDGRARGLGGLVQGLGRWEEGCGGAG